MTPSHRGPDEPGGRTRPIVFTKRQARKAIEVCTEQIPRETDGGQVNMLARIVELLEESLD